MILNLEKLEQKYYSPLPVIFSGQLIIADVPPRLFAVLIGANHATDEQRDQAACALALLRFQFEEEKEQGKCVWEEKLETLLNQHQMPAVAFLYSEIRSAWYGPGFQGGPYVPAILRALGRVDSPDTKAARLLLLILALTHDNLLWVAEAAEALGQLGDPQARLALAHMVGLLKTWPLARSGIPGKIEKAMADLERVQEKPEPPPDCVFSRFALKGTQREDSPLDHPERG